MNFLDKIQTSINGINTKEFRQYTIIASIIFSLMVGFLLYRYFATISKLRKQMITINKQREEAQELLERYDMVRKQRVEVDERLAKDTSFKIAGYFNNLMNILSITNKKTREPEVSTELLDNGYTEVKLYATFKDMDMKTISTLLDKLEQFERVYIKDIEMYKPTNNASSLNMNIIIATLEPKAQSTEQVE